MTFPDPNLGRPLSRPGTDVENAENVQDVIPPTERNQDPLRVEQAHDLHTGNVEPKPSDRAEPIAERVYAPASERVPKQPVPGHREVIEHTDTHTPERQAAAAEDTEPTFTRVPRPSNPGDSTTDYAASVSTTPGAYASPLSNPGLRSDDYSGEWQSGRKRMFLGIGASWFTVLGCAVGVWLFMRWRAERNKPVNRLRRQARQAWEIADEWRGRMPMPDEAARPAAGLGSMLVPLAIVLWRQSQSKSRQDAVREEAMGRAERIGQQAQRMGRQADKAARHADKTARRASQTISDVDWQQRLMHLKERWNPSRLELEKIQISRH